MSESELANYPQRQTSYGSLIGIERKQIEQKLGAPDKVEKQGDGQKEVWTYGRSMVFFVDGRVTAWSDLGEIKERENLSRIKEQRPNDTDLVNEEWINPWTPSKQHLSVIDVLMEIVDR